MVKTAVVILNWNGVAMLRKFLPFVLRTLDDDAALYVADNASNDDSCRVVEEEFPDVHLIRLEQNYGFAEGYNRALAQVEAEYFVLLNSDVRVDKDWLHPLVDFMDAYPKVAACQPKLLSERNPLMFEYAGACGGFMDAYGYPFCRGRILGKVEEDDGQYDTPRMVFWATGAALMVRSAVYREVGGLDGRFFAHMEEIDLCWRLRSRGWGIYCVPQSVVFHVGAATLKVENPRKTFLNFRNNLLMLYKNLPDGELERVMRIRGYLDLLAAFQFLLTGKVANFKAVLSARRQFRKMVPEYREIRRENLLKTVSPCCPERGDFSILKQYYLLGKRKFSKLPL
jgi:GT2 family glycosyltransferase